MNTKCSYVTIYVARLSTDIVLASNTVPLIIHVRKCKILTAVSAY